MNYYTRFAALDVHKDTILPAIAVIGGGEPEN